MDRVLKIAAALSSYIVLTTTTAHAADAGHGKDLFDTKCALCHNADKGGPNKIGPNLWGVTGRPSASLSSYSYSTAMQKAHLTWTVDVLEKYLLAPKAMLPGIRMTFTGFSKADDAADVAAYLSTLK